MKRVRLKFHRGMFVDEGLVLDQLVIQSQSVQGNLLACRGEKGPDHVRSSKTYSVNALRGMEAREQLH